MCCLGLWLPLQAVKQDHADHLTFGHEAPVLQAICYQNRPRSTISHEAMRDRSKDGDRRPVVAIHSYGATF